MNSGSSLHTQWLTHFPADMQHHMATVYLETMTEDLEALKAHLHEPKHLLQTVHKIKGGLANRLRAYSSIRFIDRTIGPI